MYIIVEVETNVVVDYSDTIQYQSNGYPVVRSNTDQSLAYASQSYSVAETDKIPEDYKPSKYKYVDGAFVENPDYIDPEINRLYTLDEAATLLAQEVSQNGYDA